jgi:hypothetical protein
LKAADGFAGPGLSLAERAWASSTIEQNRGMARFSGPFSQSALRSNTMPHNHVREKLLDLLDRKGLDGEFEKLADELGVGR